MSNDTATKIAIKQHEEEARLVAAMARATYENYIDGVEDLEPSWDALPEDHRHRMTNAARAALIAARGLGYELIRR